MKSLLHSIFALRTSILITILVVALGAAIATIRIARAQSTSPEEVIPTAEQQQPVKDLLAEQDRTVKQITQQYNDRITGAVNVIMSQIKDPKSGKTGLSTTEWVAQSDGKGGFKFVTVQAAQAAAAKAQQQAAPPSQ